MSNDPVKILAVSCSPGRGGKTHTALAAVLAGAAETGAMTELLEIADFDDLTTLADRFVGFDGFVLGAPMYRASFASSYKALLDVVPRAMNGDDGAPLTGRAALTVATAASEHHMLGISSMRDPLVDFFACHVVSPGLYVTGSDYDDDGKLSTSMTDRAGLMGLALLELSSATRASVALKAVTARV